MKYWIALAIVSFITLARPALAGLSGWCLIKQNWTLAWLLFIASSSTDLIDGVLARYWGVETKFGAGADLICDYATWWLYIPAAYIYGQKFSPWCQCHLIWWKLATYGVILATVIIVLTSTTQFGKTVFDWHQTKGHFWLRSKIAKFK